MQDIGLGLAVQDIGLGLAVQGYRARVSCGGI